MFYRWINVATRFPREEVVSMEEQSEQVGSSLETNMATSDESDYCAYRLFLEFLVQKDEACV